MSNADPREPVVEAPTYWRRTEVRSYGFAVLAVAAVTILHYVLGVTLAFNQPFILFYPVILLIALQGGFAPGFFSTILSAATAAYLFVAPLNSLLVSGPRDILRLVLFLAMGVAISGLSDRFRKRRNRLQEFERVVEGVEAGVIVVDRDYRYVIANRAFLGYRGMERAQLIGRSVAELMKPGVFETTIKHKLDECFRGKIVKFEKRYEYPALGERDFFVSYFPIEGPTGVERVACILQDITERKQTEETLHEREEKFHQMADNIQEIFWMVDAVTKQAIYVNQAFEQITGRTVASLREAPLSYREIIHADDRARVLSRLDEAAKTGVFDEQFRIVRPDGTVRWVGAQGFPVRDAQGKIYRLAGVVQDITERKCVEEALTESEDRFRDLFEHSEDLVCTHDLQGNLLSVNPAPARVLGYEVSELLKIAMRDLIAPEYRGLFDEYLARIKVTGSDKGLMVVLPRTGGRRIWEYSNTLRTEGVASPIVRGIAHDVTERRRAEIACRESEERFRVALKSSPITVFSQDRNLRYRWIYNPHLYWQLDVIGRTDDEIIGPAEAAGLVELKRRVLETGVGLREEVTIPHGGRNYSFDLTIEPLFDSTGSLIGITGASMDVARLRERADGLQEAKDKLAQEKRYLENEIQADLGFEEIIGQSSALREVLNKARVVAPTDSTVLLLGETGTGKELVARAIHALSSREDKSFIKLNCAAVPSGLLESELFGHERGAFTGAVGQKVGRLELADKGTLFLDEVGELPLELQPKLLRVLQDREFERLGGVRTLHVDVRIISATNRDLKREVADKNFREDLFYRLNVFPILLPALRDRRSDIPILVDHFMHQHSARMGKHIDPIPGETMDVLQNWNWPGNIRELENMIERMVILTKGRVLAPPPVELEAPQEGMDDSLTEMEREHIVRILRETNGVLSGEDGAASRLGIKRTTLQSMLKRFNIDLEDFRRNTGT